MASITKPCGRCGGTGHYSYNQIDGTMCYGCGGKGVVIDKKAAKKAGINITPTAELKTCKPGDIIESSKLPYRVNSVVWKQIGWPGVEFSMSAKFWANQIVKATCLVDDKNYKFYRTVYDATRMAIEPTAEMVGQSAELESWETSGSAQVVK